jgi:hypothetical protein
MGSRPFGRRSFPNPGSSPSEGSGRAKKRIVSGLLVIRPEPKIATPRALDERLCSICFICDAAFVY